MNMHGVQRITYENWSYEVFEGFYNTIIGDFSNVYDIEPEPPAGYEYDVRDWEGYKNEVAEQFTSLLEDQLDVWKRMDGSPVSEILSNLEFKGIYSPREYNFTTDKVEIEMDVDVDILKEYCFKINRAKFDNYLHENFTSRDGFWSFVHNNVHDFEIELENGSESDMDRDIQVMIEFYLLQEVDFEDLREDLYEHITETQLDYLCLYNDEDGCQYEYSYHSDENKEWIEIGEKIND